MNVDLGDTHDAQFSTGNFKVAKISCRKCRCDLGIKYVTLYYE